MCEAIFFQCRQTSQFFQLHFANIELPAILRKIDVDPRTNWYRQAGGRFLSMCLFDLTFNLNTKPKSFCISNHFPFIMSKVLLQSSAVFCVNDHDIRYKYCAILRILAVLESENNVPAFSVMSKNNNFFTFPILLLDRNYNSFSWKEKPTLKLIFSITNAKRLFSPHYIKENDFLNAASRDI